MRFEPYGQYVFPGRCRGHLRPHPDRAHHTIQQPDATGVGNLDMGGFFMPTHGPELILRAGPRAVDRDRQRRRIGRDHREPVRATDRLCSWRLPTTRPCGCRRRRCSSRACSSSEDDAGLRFGDRQTDRRFVGPSFAPTLRPASAWTLSTSRRSSPTSAINGDDVSRTVEQRFFHTAALSVRTTGDNQLHFGTVFPLDDGLRGELWIISLGYQRAMF